jgi:hypothetical protein
MKEQITLSRQDAEELIDILECRIDDKEVMAFPSTHEEETAISMLRDKLMGRIP